MDNPAKKAKVFISYSHEDKRIARELCVYLSQYPEYIDVFIDNKDIKTGEKITKKIKDFISKANVVIILHSVYFTISPFIQNIELPLIKERMKKYNNLNIIPIYVRAGESTDPLFKDMKFLEDNKNMRTLKPYQREEIWQKLSEDIRNHVAESLREIDGRSNTPDIDLRGMAAQYSQLGDEESLINDFSRSRFYRSIYRPSHSSTPYLWVRPPKSRLSISNYLPLIRQFIVDDLPSRIKGNPIFLNLDVSESTRDLHRQTFGARLFSRFILETQKRRTFQPAEFYTPDLRTSGGIGNRLVELANDCDEHIFFCIYWGDVLNQAAFNSLEPPKNRTRWVLDTIDRIEELKRIDDGENPGVNRIHIMYNGFVNPNIVFDGDPNLARMEAEIITVRPVKIDRETPKKFDLLSIDELMCEQIYTILDMATRLDVVTSTRGSVSITFDEIYVIGYIFLDKSALTLSALMDAASLLTAELRNFNYLLPTNLEFDETSFDEFSMNLGDVAVCDSLFIRARNQEFICRLAKEIKIPIVNAMSEVDHPIQVLYDLYVIRKEFSRLDGIRLGYIGPFTSTLLSLLKVGPVVGVDIKVCLHKGHEKLINDPLVFQNIQVSDNVEELVQWADVIYSAASDYVRDKTSSVPGYGHELQINKKLLRSAKNPMVKVMHRQPPDEERRDLSKEVLQSMNCLAKPGFTKFRHFVQAAIVICLAMNQVE